MGPYLHISCLAWSYIPMVIQSGECNILNQLLELLIAGNKICLTVNLDQPDTWKANRACWVSSCPTNWRKTNSNNNADNEPLAPLALPPPWLLFCLLQTGRSDPLWLCDPPACLLCSSPPAGPAHLASSLPEHSENYIKKTKTKTNKNKKQKHRQCSLYRAVYALLFREGCTCAMSLSNFSRAFLQLMNV